MISVRYRFLLETIKRYQGDITCGESRGKPSGPGAGRQRQRGMQGEDPCRECRGQRPFPESRGGALWVGCRVTTPARDARGRPLPGIQRAAPVAQSCVESAAARRVRHIVLGITCRFNRPLSASAPPRRPNTIPTKKGGEPHGGSKSIPS